MRGVLFFLCAIAAGPYVQAQEVSSQPAIAGNYYGFAPCADCKIIETQLELTYMTDTSGEFSLRDKYIGRQGTDMSSRIAGEWVKIVNPKLGNLVVLNNDTPDKAIYYLLKKDGSLLPLDQELQKIEAPIDCTLKRK